MWRGQASYAAQDPSIIQIEISSTMEGQQYKIPEDPSQTLPEQSPMGSILSIFFFFDFAMFQRTLFLEAILASICL